MGMAEQEAIDATHPAYQGGKFLTFFLDDEEYGIEILKVREIVGMMGITPVPRTPGHLLGVVNLRGKVIPVTDLRLRFGMESAERTSQTCIIVVQAQEVETGVMVDRVSEVTYIPGDDIQDAPQFGSGVEADYLLGIGKSEGRVTLLLAIDQVLARDDDGAVQALMNAAA